MTFINESTERAWFLIQRFDNGSDELAAQLAEIPLSGDCEPLAYTPPGFALIGYVGPGRSSPRPITPRPGIYLLEAGTLDQLESGDEHIWRAAGSVAVVAG